MTSSGSPEFNLAVECCKRSFLPAPPPIEVADNVDWDHFLRLVRFHRIEGLAWNGVAQSKKVPETIRVTLRDAALAIAAENLRAKAECEALLRRFQAAKAPLLFLKGLTLGALAYGNPTLKSAIDIDLLIDPSHLREASEILNQCGYELACPQPAQLQAWHRTWKESLWLKGGRSVQLDLHTRAANNPGLIASITVDSASQAVEVGDGISLPTLAKEELFAYLTVHGASSGWFRIKWISDFAALLNAEPPAEIERLYRRSQQLGAGRAAGQALLLANAIFGSLENLSELSRELSSDSRTRMLFRTALGLVAGDLVEPTEQRLGTLAIHWTQFFLLPGLRYKGSEFLGQGGRALTRF